MGTEDETVDTLTNRLFKKRLELAREDFLREQRSRYFCITSENKEYRKEEKPYR